MSFGIKVYNSSNTLQIDDSYKNFFYNRSISYSHFSQIPALVNSLSANEIAAFVLNTASTEAGTLTIFSKYPLGTPTSGFGLSVFKEDGSIAFSSESRAMQIRGNVEVIWNSFVFPELQIKHIYLPEVLPGKTRNIAFNLFPGDINMYNYNMFKHGDIPQLHEGTLYINTSISNGIEHIQIAFEVPANEFLSCIIIDS